MLRITNWMTLWTVFERFQQNSEWPLTLVSHKTVPIKTTLCTDSLESLFTVLISLLKFLLTLPGLLYSFKFLPSDFYSTSASFNKLSLSLTEHSKFTSHANSCVYSMLPQLNPYTVYPCVFLANLFLLNQ